MPIHAMLTVDLQDADAEQRGKFDNEMRAKGWTRVSTVTTTWSATYSDAEGADVTVVTARLVAARAAKAAGIEKYSMAVQAGNNRVEAFEE